MKFSYPVMFVFEFVEDYIFRNISFVIDDVIYINSVRSNTIDEEEAYSSVLCKAV